MKLHWPRRPQDAVVLASRHGAEHSDGGDRDMEEEGSHMARDTVAACAVRRGT